MKACSCACPSRTETLVPYICKNGTARWLTDIVKVHQHVWADGAPWPDPIATAHLILMVDASVQWITSFALQRSSGSLDMHAGCTQCLQKCKDEPNTTLRMGLADEAVPLQWSREKANGGNPPGTFTSLWNMPCDQVIGLWKAQLLSCVNVLSNHICLGVDVYPVACTKTTPSWSAIEQHDPKQEQLQSAGIMCCFGAEQLATRVATIRILGQASAWEWLTGPTDGGCTAATQTASEMLRETPMHQTMV